MRAPFLRRPQTAPFLDRQGGQESRSVPALTSSTSYPTFVQVAGPGVLFEWRVFLLCRACRARLCSLVTVLGSEWLSSREASELLGVSVRTLSRAARSGSVSAERGAGGRWLIERASALAWLCSDPVPRRVRLRPDRYGSVDRRPHVELLDATGLSDRELAAQLRVAVSKLRRWREVGVANLYVARIRALTDERGSGRGS
jgi:excisionase family DNA binding protein